jgi:hypothetical protein
MSLSFQITEAAQVHQRVKDLKEDGVMKSISQTL